MTKDESIQQANDRPPGAAKSQSFRSLVMVFTIFGAFGVLAGLINLLGAFSSGLSSVQWTDAIFNLVFGILLFICSRVLAKGKVLVIWIFGGSILFSILYSSLMERGFNFVITAVGALFIWLLFKLKKQGELL